MDRLINMEGSGFLGPRSKPVWTCQDCGKLVMDFQAPDLNTPEARTQQEYEDELRRYTERANKREEEN